MLSGRSRVMPGDGVREDLGNAPMVRLFGERRDYSGAGGAMIDRRASCEPGLKLEPVFAEWLEKGERAPPTRRATFFSRASRSTTGIRVGERVPFRFRQIFQENEHTTMGQSQ